MDVVCGTCGRLGHARNNSECPYYGSAKPRPGGEVVLSNILLSILDTVESRRDLSTLFLQPVSKTVVPDYYDIIKNPMDLSTIRTNVTKKLYKSIKEFRGDVCQMVLNAHKYNAVRHPYIPPLADQLLELVDCFIVKNAKALADAEAGTKVHSGKRKADALKTPSKAKVASSVDGGVVKPLPEPLMRKLPVPSLKEHLDSIPPTQAADESVKLAFQLLQNSLHLKNIVRSLVKKVQEAECKVQESESKVQEARESLKKFKRKDLEQMLANAKADASREEAKVKALETRLIEENRPALSDD